MISALFLRFYYGNICVFLGFETAFPTFKTLQSDYNNEFYVKRFCSNTHNGKEVVYNHTYLDWLTEWQPNLCKWRSQQRRTSFTIDEVATSSPDIIIPATLVGLKK